MKVSRLPLILNALLALAALPLAGLAQETSTRSPEEIAAAIQNVNRHIESRQARVTEITNDLIRLDQRVEARIDKVVEILEGITDSEDSQVRVAILKQRVIEGLKKTIDVYDQKRRAIQEETMQRNPSLTREELFGDLGKFDDRINKRVEQILGIAKSMPGYEELDKTKTVEGGGFWGWGGGYEVTNPEYVLNRKEVRHTDAEKKEIGDEIDAAIARLESQNRDIDEKLKKNITDKYREMLTYEKNRNLQLIAERESQKDRLFSAQDTGEEKVSLSAAMDIENMLKDMAGDLNRDFYQIFNIYQELNEERAALKTLDEQLASLKAMQ